MIFLVKKGSKKNKLTPKSRDLACRLNNVFKLKTQGFSIPQIAKKLKIQKYQVSADLVQLRGAVSSQKTLQKLYFIGGPLADKRRAEVARLIKEPGMLHSEIARRVGVSEAQISHDITFLKEEAKAKAAAKSKKWKPKPGVELKTNAEKIANVQRVRGVVEGELRKLQTEENRLRTAGLTAKARAARTQIETYLGKLAALGKEEARLKKE